MRTIITGVLLFMLGLELGFFATKRHLAFMLTPNADLELIELKAYGYGVLEHAYAIGPTRSRMTIQDLCDLEKETEEIKTTRFVSLDGMEADHQKRILAIVELCKEPSNEDKKPDVNSKPDSTLDDHRSVTRAW